MSVYDQEKWLFILEPVEVGLLMTLGAAFLEEQCHLFQHVRVD